MPRLQEGTGEAGEKMKAQRHTVVVGSQTIVGKVAETGEFMLANDVEIEPLYQPNPASAGHTIGGGHPVARRRAYRGCD